MPVYVAEANKVSAALALILVTAGWNVSPDDEFKIIELINPNAFTPVVMIEDGVDLRAKPKTLVNWMVEVDAVLGRGSYGTTKAILKVVESLFQMSAGTVLENHFAALKPKIIREIQKTTAGVPSSILKVRARPALRRSIKKALRKNL